MYVLLGGIFLGWSLGANGASYSFGPSVTSKMIRFWTAALLCSILVIIGAIWEGRAGIETLQGLTSITLKFAVISSISAAIAVTVMNFLGLPVSVSQAAVGAIIGIGVINRQLNFSGLGKVVLCWVGTPTGAIAIAVFLYHVLRPLNNRLARNIFLQDSVLRVLLVAAGCYGAYALGANNVANVTAVFVGAGYLSVAEAAIIGGASIALGVLTFSKRVMETVGSKLVKLDAFSATIVVTAVSVTVHIYALVGVPVPMSQATVGAVLGIGLTKGVQTVKKKTLFNILTAWTLTPFISCLLAILINFLSNLQYVPAP